MEIKRVEENDRIGEFLNFAFSEYADDCDVALNFEEFCFAAEDDESIEKHVQHFCKVYMR